MRPDSSRRWWMLTLTGGLLAVGVAVAATPSWKQLSSQQQNLIKPALLTGGGDFDKLPESRREALLRGADRWLAMSPAQRTMATQQFSQWQQLSNAEKLAVLERRERFRKMSPNERKALLETRDRFLEKTAQEQVELREDYASNIQPQLEGLTSQPLMSPGAEAPGSTSPLGLPATTLPSNAATVPLLPR
ncbi:MAG: DUF3106 domain-containing protein [Pseudomonadota bacterium]